MNILETIEKLRNTQGTNAKVSFLKENHNSELKEILSYAYDPSIIFGITPKTLKRYSNMRTLSHDESLNLLLKTLKVQAHKLEGHGRDMVESMFRQLHDSWQELAICIFKRNLDIGLNTKKLNEIFGPGFIPETPYMGAQPFTKEALKDHFRKNDYMFSEEKYDGRYSNTISNFEQSVMVSRNGKNSSIFGNVEKDAILVASEFGYVDGVVLNGELIIEGVDRYTSNGMISSILSLREKEGKGLLTQKEEIKFYDVYKMTLQQAADKVVQIVWDFIPYKYYSTGKEFKFPRHQRVKILEKYLELSGVKNIKLADIRICYDYKEAIDHYKEVEAKGGEGTIVKTPDGTWVNKKPKWQLKLKKIFDCDLKIVGFKPGSSENKFKETLGSLIVQSDDGILETDASGMGEEQRYEIWDNKDSYLGKILVITCNGLSHDKSGKPSLLHPRCSTEDVLNTKTGKKEKRIIIRNDKSVANTYTEIVEIDRMVMELI